MNYSTYMDGVEALETLEATVIDSDSRPLWPTFYWILDRLREAKWCLYTEDDEKEFNNPMQKYTLRDDRGEMIRGKAKTWSGKYQESLCNLLGRLSKANIPWTYGKAAHPLRRDLLVLGEPAIELMAYRARRKAKKEELEKYNQELPCETTEEEVTA